MAVTIMVYELGEKQIEKDVCGEYEYIQTKSYEQWDSLRHSGDRDFAATNEIEFDSVSENDHERYYRPTDFIKAKEWVDKNIQVEGNRERYYEIFDAMQKNKNLYFVFAW